MRRKLVQIVLPFLFCAIPILAALVIAAALETKATKFYLEHLTGMDFVILTMGFSLFTLQMILAYRAMKWIGTGFNEKPDPWLSHLAQAAEWFPLMGLLGTVAGILQTFSGITPNTPTTEIIARYAPAITATGSGLFMALINILPTWVVRVGRDLIVGLSGEQPLRERSPGEAPKDSSAQRIPTPQPAPAPGQQARRVQAAPKSPTRK